MAFGASIPNVKCQAQPEALSKKISGISGAYRGEGWLEASVGATMGLQGDGETMADTNKLCGPGG